MNPWCITVPSTVRDGELIAIAYDDKTREGYIEVPYARSLRDIDEASVALRAREFVANASEMTKMQSHHAMLVERAAMLARRAFEAGYINRAGDERRARAGVKRDQLGAVVRVMTGWDIFDMRSPLLGGGR